MLQQFQRCLFITSEYGCSEIADGSELQIPNNWKVNNYPDIVFVNITDTPYLPDPVDTVVEVTLKD